MWEGEILLKNRKLYECNKIYYDIVVSIPKNQLLPEFFNKKITSVYLDTNYLLYCGDEKGNLLI